MVKARCQHHRYMGSTPVTPSIYLCPGSSMDEQPFAEGVDVGSSPTQGTILVYAGTMCRQWRTQKWRRIMNTRADRRRILVEMRDELMQRLEQVQADVDAANRLIAAHESTDQPIAPSSVEEIRQCSITCLAGHGEPMHRQDLLDCLITQGIHIVGKIPVNNLGAILSRYLR